MHLSFRFYVLRHTVFMQHACMYACMFVYMKYEVCMDMYVEIHVYILTYFILCKHPSKP